MEVAKLLQSVRPDPVFGKKIEDLSHEKISACFQCEKCSNGCPVTFAMDIIPHKLMRSVLLGMKTEVLQSDTIWVCASCETCTTRCPNNIDIAHVMDTLRQLSSSQAVKDSQKNVPLFHSAFLKSIRWYGRLHEMTMVINFALKSEGISGLLKQAKSGVEMVRKGKIKIIPSRLFAGTQVKNIFRQTERKVNS
jgi:heterodisulfide reductase subunit C